VVKDSHERRARGRQYGFVLADGVATAVIVFLVVATVFTVGALAPALWEALLQTASSDRISDPRVCAEIKDDKTRLACFDEYGKGLMTPPAKGAFAPPQAFGRSDPDSK
jgi:hypothetical protein